MQMRAQEEIAGATERVHFKQKLSKNRFHYDKRIGEQSIADFFENYKHIDKSIQRKEHKKEAQTAFLKKCS
jgi:hypothetical protein